MVTIENAAQADSAGLLNPVLQRYLARVFTLNVFELPAVEVRF